MIGTTEQLCDTHAIIVVIPSQCLVGSKRFLGFIPGDIKILPVGVLVMVRRKANLLGYITRKVYNYTSRTIIMLNVLILSSIHIARTVGKNQPNNTLCTGIETVIFQYTCAIV